MDDDRKSSLPPPSEVDAMCDDDKMPDEAEITPETSGARKEMPAGVCSAEIFEPTPTEIEMGRQILAWKNTRGYVRGR